MLDFPRWKVLSIVISLAIGVLLSVPSFIPESVTARWGLTGLPRVNLGLDLSGGSHLMLEADTADLAKQNVERMEELVRTEMRRASPPIAIGDISTTGGRLSFFVRDSGQIDAAVERIRTLTQPSGMSGQRDWNVAVVDSTRIVLTPTDAGTKASVDSAMEVAKEVVRKRIDEMGTREPNIVRQGSERILVQVPGLQDPAALKALIGRTAKLEFKLVDLTADPAEVARGRAPVGSEVVPYPDNPGGVPFIAVKRRAMLTGDELVNAQLSYNSQTNEPVVSITFNSDGGRKFARVTQENVNKPFAMILDGKVLSAPNINEPILGGQAQISGRFTTDSATQLAIALRSGKLPVALKVVEERTVGPELGADSIRAGTLASAIAVLAVVLFMLVTYGRFGIYANLAVIINVFVIIGVMALLNATLTLPGIAGFVLTIGAAVDANVLINERMREELRRGRSITQAVEHGYKEASRTIFEANVTHAIAGGIMFLLGSAQVKGFAVVLLIGIATSVFTAVVFTRMLVSQWLRRNRPTHINI
ncbi:protein translocase subunit SecD [Rhizorhabdus dicambivorans]|uniref:Protein translocase subunit SecD n=1 Tax=Rhizorhabdus dicambivorans TaxID=1850238 RepID=A0A2A4FSB8_9SPHN|nr:protein translocase subunit SecD [Rhizorhabdus dicambivorans]ATE66431.1 protein translocase subunit SecD [Rhizorhabdus dicambivorans]PCE41077.1 protein translocase subunit SecD [Rhizorhabdus dicambivorans]